MLVTAHAKERWEQRFPGLSITNEFARTRRVGKKMRKKIKASCPQNAEFCTAIYKGRHLRMTREKIVFVVAPQDTIITVLDFRDR